MTVEGKYKRSVPTHQADAILNRAAPVINDWYDVLPETNNATIYNIIFRVLTAGETLEVRVTLDGEPFLATQIAVANTFYRVLLSEDTTTGTLSVHTAVGSLGLGCKLMGRVCRVEVRKTTAAGAGNLQGKVMYGIE